MHSVKKDQSIISFTYKNIQNSELSSVNRGVATLNAISGHDFHLPLEGNSKFIRPPKIIFASFIISTPVLNQSLNQNDSNFEFRQIQFLSCQQKSTLDFEKPAPSIPVTSFLHFCANPKKHVNVVKTLRWLSQYFLRRAKGFQNGFPSWCLKLTTLYYL